MKYWESLDQLVSSHKLVIDRRKGSSHPDFPDSIYPLDYGYLESTVSGDGHGIDVWRGSQEDKSVNAVLNTVDTRTKIMESKILIGCTDEEILTILNYHNSFSQSALLLKRKPKTV